jgi:hypothetical protein
MNISLNLLKKLVAVEESFQAHKGEIEQNINYFKPALEGKNYDQMKSGLYVRSFEKEILIENKYRLDLFIVHYLILKIFYNSISRVGNKTFINFPQTRVRLPKVQFQIVTQEKSIQYDQTNHIITLSKDFLRKTLKNEFNYEPERFTRIESDYLQQVFNKNSKEHIFKILDVLKNLDDKIEKHKVNIHKMTHLSQMSKNIRNSIISNAFIENMENICFYDDYLREESILNLDNSNEQDLRNFLNNLNKVKSLIEAVKENMNKPDCRISDFNDATIELDINFKDNIVKFEADARVYGEFEYYSGSFEFEF